MLVLTRHDDGSVVITNKHDGTRIIVHVCRIDRDKVKLGFTADREQYTIHRDEVQEIVDFNAGRQT